VPRLVDDLATLRSARRLRGLREWHPRLLVGLLVRAIRHADQLSIAMDARGFGSGPRSIYRPVRWTALDAVTAIAALLVLVAALLASR
jgi:energy-coupling factor transport system permease protein